MTVTFRRAVSIGVLALVTVVSPTVAFAAADEHDVFVATVDGASYGLLGSLSTSVSEREVDLLGALTDLDADDLDLTVTAADHDEVSGDVALLLTARTPDGDYVCGIVRVSGVDGTQAAPPVVISDGGTLEPLFFDSPCTSLDTFSELFVAGAIASAVESIVPEASPDVLTQAASVGPNAFMATASGELFVINTNDGIAAFVTQITYVEGVPLEALTVVPVGEGPSANIYLGLAYGTDIVSWLGTFGDVLLPEPAAGTVVGLDWNAEGVLWFTWLNSDGETGLTAVTPPDDPFEITISPVSAAPAAADTAPADTAPADPNSVALDPAEGAEVLSVFSLTIDGSPIRAQAVTVVPRGFGTVQGDNELADTGADTGVVTTLALIAAALAGIGIVLMVIRGVSRRRERQRQGSGEHPIP